MAFALTSGSLAPPPLSLQRAHSLRRQPTLSPGQRLLLTGSKSRICVSATGQLFSLFKNKPAERKAAKEELLLAIASLDRGAAANPEDSSRIDKLAKKLEALNPTKEPLKSALLNGKWELLYTTSESILKSTRPKWLRPSGPVYQAINVDTLRAQNRETWPFFNEVTADLSPLSGKKVAVNFDYFKIAGLIKIKAPGRARGELEITYLDEDVRVSRGDRGNLFILRMVDPSYRVPLKS